MLQPTFKNRTRSLDVARGFAVLGIFLANLPAFIAPLFAAFSENGTSLPEMLTLAFVNGKMRSTLAVFFGAGLWLQYQKRKDSPDLWPGGYLKRSFFLGLFGLAHGYLLWPGDILYIYAWTAFYACWAVTWSPKVLRVLLGITITIYVVGGVLGTVVIALLPASASTPAASPRGWEWVANLLVTGVPGTLPSLGRRAIEFGIFSFFAPLIALLYVPLFWLGTHLAREGVLQSPSQHPQTRNLMLGLGLGLGLPLNLVPLAFPGQVGAFHGLAETLTGPLLALGYLMTLAVLGERFASAPPVRALAQVGTVSLSVYLLESFIATRFFERPGVYGVIPVNQAWPFVFVIVAAGMLFAHFWLRRFSIGPAEWLLRSLTEGRKMPWRVS